MKNRKAVLAIFLAISIGNYSRLHNTDNIRAITFISIMTIGIFTGLLLNQLLAKKKE